MHSIIKSLLHYRKVYKQISIFFLLIYFTQLTSGIENYYYLTTGVIIILFPITLNRLQKILHKSMIRHSLIGPWYMTYVQKKWAYDYKTEKMKKTYTERAKTSPRIIRKIFERRICRMEIDTYLHVVIEENAWNNQERNAFTLFCCPSNAKIARKFGDFLLSELKEFPIQYRFSVVVVHTYDGMWELMQKEIVK